MCKENIQGTHILSRILVNIMSAYIQRLKIVWMHWFASQVWFRSMWQSSKSQGSEFMAIFLHYFFFIILIINWINPKKYVKIYNISKDTLPIQYKEQSVKKHTASLKSVFSLTHKHTLTYCNSLSFKKIFAEIQSGTKTKS